MIYIKKRTLLWSTVDKDITRQFPEYFRAHTMFMSA